MRAGGVGCVVSRRFIALPQPRATLTEAEGVMRKLLKPVILLVLVVATLWMLQALVPFLRQDACLDRGGSWNSGTGRCDLE
jgi:hypothetical protein